MHNKVLDFRLISFSSRGQNEKIQKGFFPLANSSIEFSGEDGGAFRIISQTASLSLRTDSPQSRDLWVEKSTSSSQFFFFFFFVFAAL
jgi:hypothetical protein